AQAALAGPDPAPPGGDRAGAAPPGPRLAPGQQLPPSLRLAKLAQLRHPLSVDLYAEKVVARARFVLVRCLGGLDYWRYGIERLAQVCRAGGIPLAVLPGDDRPDPRLDAFATVAPELRETLDAYFRAGGPDNLRHLLRRIAAEIGRPVVAAPPRALPRGFPWCPGCGPADLAAAVPAGAAGDGRGEALFPAALVLVYRSAVLGGDTAPAASLAAALWERGLTPVILAVSSLKDPEAVAVVRAAI
ncbi:cobaltochelatase subunit CobN, partial [Methylobacterium crusticola]